MYQQLAVQRTACNSMGEHGRVAVKFAHQASEVQATLATLRFVRFSCGHFYHFHVLQASDSRKCQTSRILGNMSIPCFIWFIVGTRGSQSCTRIMHVYFAGIPGNFRWRTACRNTCLLICPGMSKHPWLYGYSPEAFWEIEWSQMVRFIRIDVLYSEQSTTFTIILSPYLYVQTVHFLTFCHRLCLIVTVTVYTGTCYTESESGNQHLV